jgi:hypothetical protein
MGTADVAQIGDSEVDADVSAVFGLGIHFPASILRLLLL